MNESSPVKNSKNMDAAGKKSIRLNFLLAKQNQEDIKQYGNVLSDEIHLKLYKHRKSVLEGPSSSHRWVGGDMLEDRFYGKGECTYFTLCL